MIACWPNHIEAGSQSDLLSAFWDMMPTMCDVAGVECPPTDGISMLPTMLGEDNKQENMIFCIGNIRKPVVRRPFAWVIGKHS